MRPFIFQATNGYVLEYLKKSNQFSLKIVIRHDIINYFFKWNYIQLIKFLPNQNYELNKSTIIS